MHHRLRNYFGRMRWYSLVKRLMWNLGSLCLQIGLILMQDRCTVCMMHHMELLDEVYHIESRFGPVVDRISSGAR